MNERLSLLLCADIALLLREMDGVSGSVVLDDRRVVDRDVGRLLVEIVDGVTALAHNLGHEPVRVAHCARRIVDECCLHHLPGSAYLSSDSGFNGRMSSSPRLRSRAASSFSAAFCSPASNTVRSYSGPNRSLSRSVLLRWVADSAATINTAAITTLAAIKIHPQTGISCSYFLGCPGRCPCVSSARR